MRRDTFCARPILSIRVFTEGFLGAGARVGPRVPSPDEVAKERIASLVRRPVRARCRTGRLFPLDG